MVFLFVVGGVMWLQGAVYAEAPTLQEPDFVDKWVIKPLAMLSVTLAQIVVRVILAVFSLMQQILVFNNFTGSSVVIAGWSIVRDAMNLFFVIILVFVAFATIINYSKYQWNRIVPKVLFTAIVINFSKTICGLMIDASQVVTLTFANAMRELLGGNFLQLFGLLDVFEISKKAEALQGATASGGAPGISDFDLLAGGVMALAMTSIVLLVTIILCAVYVYRLVMLWILIVLSPLAFFLGGIKELSPEAGGGYGKWWKEMKCLLYIGPVLTFFLWLALSVAGAGSIASDFSSAGASGGFAKDVFDANVSGFLLSIFDSSKFLSFVIGIAIIFAGIDAAQQFCSGGFVGEQLGTAKKYARNIAYGYAKDYGDKARKWAQQKAYDQAKRPVLYARRETAKGLAATVGKSKYAPKFLRRDLDKRATAARKEEAEIIQKKFEKKYGGTSKDFQRDTVAALLGSGKSWDQHSGADKALMLNSFKNTKEMDDLVTSGRLDAKAWGNIKDGLKKSADPDTVKLVKAFEKSNQHISKKYGKINTRKDLGEVNDISLLDEGFKEYLRNTDSDVYDKKTKRALKFSELIEQGTMGASAKKAWTEGATAIVGDMSEEQLDLMTDKQMAIYLPDAKTTMNALDKNKDLAPRMMKAKGRAARHFNDKTAGYDKGNGDKRLSLMDLANIKANRSKADWEKLAGKADLSTGAAPGARTAGDLRGQKFVRDVKTTSLSDFKDLGSQGIAGGLNTFHAGGGDIEDLMKDSSSLSAAILAADDRSGAPLSAVLSDPDYVETMLESIGLDLANESLQGEDDYKLATTDAAKKLALDKISESSQKLEAAIKEFPQIISQIAPYFRALNTSTGVRDGKATSIADHVSWAIGADTIGNKEEKVSSTAEYYEGADEAGRKKFEDSLRSLYDTMEKFSDAPVGAGLATGLKTFRVDQEIVGANRIASTELRRDKAEKSKRGKVLEGQIKEAKIMTPGASSIANMETELAKLETELDDINTKLKERGQNLLNVEDKLIARIGQKIVGKVKDQF